jgi:hypothetical protein
VTAQLPTTGGRRSSLRRDALRDENVRLAGRVQQLRTRLDAAERENAQLRRELARARAENPRVRSSPISWFCVAAGADQADRSEWVRVMLADAHSRNP